MEQRLWKNLPFHSPQMDQHIRGNSGRLGDTGKFSCFVPPPSPNGMANQVRLGKAWGLWQSVPFWYPLHGMACLERFRIDRGISLLPVAPNWSWTVRFQAANLVSQSGREQNNTNSKWRKIARGKKKKKKPVDLEDASVNIYWVDVYNSSQFVGWAQYLQFGRFWVSFHSNSISAVSFFFFYI